MRRSVLVLAACCFGPGAVAQTPFEVQLQDKTNLEHGGTASLVGFSPKGTYFWGVARGYNAPGRLFTWTADRKPVLSVPLELLRGPVCWSADEKTIAVVVAQKQKPGWRLALFDSATGKELGSASPAADIEVARAAEFSPDGRRLVVLVQDKNRKNQMVVYDAKSGEQKLRIDLKWERHETPGLAISPDGKVAATAVGQLRFWDVVTGNQLGDGGKRSEGAFRVRFLPNGREVVATLADRTLQLWNCGDPTEPTLAAIVGKFELGGRGNLRVFDADRFGYANGHGFEYLNRDGKRPGHMWSRLSEDDAVDLSPDGRLAVSGGPVVRVWKAAEGLTQAAAGQVLAGITRHQVIVLSADDSRLVTHDGDKTTVIDTATGKILGNATTNGYHYQGIDWSAGRTYDCDWRAGISAVDLVTKKVTPVLSNADLVGLMGPRNTERPAFQTGSDGKRHVLSRRAGGSSWALLDEKLTPLAQGQAFDQFILNTDVKRLLVKVSGSSMLLFDTETGKQVDELKSLNQGESKTPVGFSPDGKHLYATASGGAIWRMNLRSLDVERQFLGHDAVENDSRNRTLSVARKAHRVAFSGRGDRIQVWDGATGKLVCNVPNPKGKTEHVLLNSTETVLYAAVDTSPLNSPLVSQIYTWDLTKLDSGAETVVAPDK